MKNLQKRLWPDVPVGQAWTGDLEPGPLALGLLPLILSFLDALTGASVASTYLTLVCRQRQGVVWASGEEELVADAGFTGLQARNTWRKRMQLLVDAGFIKVAKGSTGPMHFTLLLQLIPRIAELVEDTEIPETAKEYLDAIEFRYFEQGVSLSDTLIPAAAPIVLSSEQLTEMTDKAQVNADEVKEALGEKDDD